MSTSTPPFPAYSGTEPYVFVCYSHRDAQIVYPLITRLRELGVNIWYDEGIAPGEVFTDELADAIEGCATFLFLASPSSVASRFCLNEVNYATSHQKRLVAAHLEPTDLTSGLELTIGLSQAVMKYALSDAEFERKVMGALTRPSFAESRPKTTGKAGRKAWPYAVLGAALVAAAVLWYWTQTIDPVGPPSVAVLPFVNVSGDPEDLYISAGLSDELRDELSRLAGLRVAARRSSIVFPDSADATTVAERLGVAMLIEGQIRRRGDALRISVQLIDGTTGFQTWSQDFDSTADSLTVAHHEIARATAVQVLPGAIMEQAPAPTTGAQSAHELMLLGRFFEQQVRDSQRVDEQTLQRVIDLYRKATKADPRSALARSRLAGALMYRGEIDEAEESVLRAVELDEDSSDVQYMLGLYYWVSGVEGSGTAYARAIELNANNSDALAAYGLWLMNNVEAQGSTGTPDVFLQRALELDPMSLTRYAALGSFYGLTGKAEKVRALFGVIEERFDNAQGYLLLARLHELVGDVDVGIAWALRARDRQPDSRDAVDKAAELFARIGDFESANVLDADSMAQSLLQRRHEELVDLGELALIDTPNDINAWYWLAFGYNATQQFPLTVRLLDMVGLPDAAIRQNRSNEAIQALGWTFIPALDRTGDRERARELAEWVVDYMAVMIGGVARARTWWPRTLQACALAILDRDDQALTLLEQLASLTETSELPWLAVLQDAACFDRLGTDSRYLAVLAELEARQREVRARVPATLAAHGVSL